MRRMKEEESARRGRNGNEEKHIRETKTRTLLRHLNDK